MTCTPVIYLRRLVGVIVSLHFFILFYMWCRLYHDFLPSSFPSICQCGRVRDGSTSVWPLLGAHDCVVRGSFSFIACLCLFFCLYYVFASGGGPFFICHIVPLMAVLGKILVFWCAATACGWLPCICRKWDLPLLACLPQAALFRLFGAHYTRA